MIVDCYTHCWKSPTQVGLRGDRQTQLVPGLLSAGKDCMPIEADARHHLAAAEPVDRTIVLGFESAYLDASIPNEDVADYVRKHPTKLIGFAGIDPSNPKQAVEAMKHARKELGMRGVSVAPAAQDFHPSASPALKVYEVAAEMGLPILFHSGPYLTARSKMEYAQPILLDEVAREFPTLRIVVAHLGYPWIDETLVLLAKHPNVYSDISWLIHQPWKAYQALLAASQYGVMDHLLFGSGFPHTSAAACIEALYGLNHLVHGTNLPSIPREDLRSIIERDALSLLGIEAPATNSNGADESPLLVEDN